MGAGSGMHMGGQYGMGVGMRMGGGSGSGGSVGNPQTRQAAALGGVNTGSASTLIYHSRDDNTTFQLISLRISVSGSRFYLQGRETCKRHVTVT